MRRTHSILNRFKSPLEWRLRSWTRFWKIPVSVATSIWSEAGLQLWVFWLGVVWAVGWAPKDVVALPAIPAIPYQPVSNNRSAIHNANAILLFTWHFDTFGSRLKQTVLGLRLGLVGLCIVLYCIDLEIETVDEMKQQTHKPTNRSLRPIYKAI